MPPRLTAGWLLDPAERAILLARFLPAYPRVIAHHVTLTTGTDHLTPLPVETAGAVVGLADDGLGVQALIVAIGGVTMRGDGSTFHITWSLAEGRQAVESNAVIAESGWSPLPAPIPLTLTPAHFGG